MGQDRLRSQFLQLVVALHLGKGPISGIAFAHPGTAICDSYECLGTLLSAGLQAGDSNPESERLSREANFEVRLPVSSEADSADRVAVLVVHGVAAKVPNREFANLEAVTNLLTFQDEDHLNACYRLNQSSTVQLHVDDLPKASETLKPDAGTRLNQSPTVQLHLDDLPKAPETLKPDAGTRYTHMLVNQFQPQPYPYTTRRNELTRTIKSEKSVPPMEVHVHEFFWADLSRPASLKGLHSISAFLRLICSVCFLGTKSLPREGVTERSGRLRAFYWILYRAQYVISWMTLIYIPIVATAFLAGIVSLYLLTLSTPTVDAVVPMLVGLSGMIGFAVWCCSGGTEKERATNWQKFFKTWLRRGLYCAAGSVLLAASWYVLGDIFHSHKFSLRYWFGVSYVVASFLITGSLVLRASSHRYHFPSWGPLLALLLLAIIWLEWSRKPLSSAVLDWTDWFFALYWYGWLLVCALNLSFWLASGLCLLGNNLFGIKSDFLEHSRGLWTACIAGTMPMAMCIVVHLGFFKALCLLFQPRELPVLTPNFFHDLRNAPFTLEVLRKALMFWQSFTDHPAIHYAYLFLILAGALALCAALPSVTAEIDHKLRDCNDVHVSQALGAATTQMFDLLRLSGEIVQRYVVIAVPIVVWHVWHVGPHQQFLTPAYWSPWCWIGIAVLGMGFIISRAYQESQTEIQSEGRDEGRDECRAMAVAMFAARVLIVAAYFSLPYFQEQIHLTWLLSVSALFVLAGVAFLFGPLLSVGVDVTSWMQEHPPEFTPRARIFARLIALLDKLQTEPYSGVVIVAHSQGAMVVTEALRYLSWVDSDRYKNLPMSLFTLGCPLRQLYAARFPWIYDWVGLKSTERVKKLNAPPQVVGAWTNAYGAGDYIGRNLWSADHGAFNHGQPSTPVTQGKYAKRSEFCLGPWAHVHYWDWRNLEVALELDRLIVELKHWPPPSSGHPV
jgi:hypothetical protein